MIRSEKGGASLVIVVMMTILISVLTIASTKLMTGELRQAIDAENGIKAYYRAEGAAEESVASIINAIASGVALPLINQNCDMDGVPTRFSTPPPYGPLPSEVSCRKIRTVTDFIQDGYISKAGTDHFDLSKNYFDRVELAWDADPIPTEAAARTFSNPLPKYADNSPAFLELTRIVYTDNDPGPATVINPSDFQVKSIILAPVQGAPGAWAPADGSGNCGTAGNPKIRFDQCQGLTGGTVMVNCDRVTDHRCAATITDFIPAIVAGQPQKRVVMRLRPYFKNMRYQMALFQNSSRVTFALDKIDIDITARIGDTYRRITQKLDVTANPTAIDAIHGDLEVCKDLRVGSEVAVGEAPNDEVIPDHCSL